ncbi:MAG: insulinase family protein, partial [bacterium]|nr:insulinase family protein [bacterium]
MRKLLILLLGAGLLASACADSHSDVSITGQISPAVQTPAEEPPVADAAAPPEAEIGEEAGAVEASSPDADAGCQAAGGAGDSPDEALLPVDPAVRIGALDNGLTYYLRSNDRPGSALSLRLAVDAGSLNEPMTGAGYAHYLAHMLFNGTEKYPGNEITGALQSIGVEFGPDINAYTSYDETVYMLDLVIDEEEGSVDTAFDVLAQWAHAATITPQDVEEERGIIRDEYRLRQESGEGIVTTVFDETYTEGSPYEGKAPIGTVEVIEATTAEDLRDFYETWYVPSNMAVVAVGDLPVETLEELVEHHFCGLAAGEAPDAPDNWSALNPQPAFAVVTSPEEAYPYLSLDIRLPSWDPKTVEGNRQLWMERIIAIMVDNRLQDGYEQGFLSQIDPTHWAEFSYTRGLRYYGTNLRAEDFSAALTDYWSLLLSLAEAGFADADLDRAATAITADLQSAVEAAATIQDRQHAARYAAHFLGGRDIGAIEDTAARVGALLEELEAGDLTERYREILDASGVIMIAVGPDPADVPGAEEMQAALDAAAPGELPEQPSEAAELLSAPEPVDPVSEGAIDALAEELDDAYEWVFANGARVSYAYSDIAENSVSMDATSWGGWSSLQEGDRPLAQYLATRAVTNSGLGDLTPSQIALYLDDRNAGVAPYIGETTEGFSGASDTAGVETMFQLMHLYMTEARIDDQAFTEAADIGDILLSLSQSDPDWQESLAYLEARFGDAFGWFNLAAPQERLDTLSPEELLDIYRQRFGGVDDLEVVVVGDVDRDTVERMARTYVGTLPAKDADSYQNRRTPSPEGVVRREVVLGPDNRSTSATYSFEAPLAVTPATQVAARVLNVILDTRLVEDVREDLGDTYAASASIGQAFTPEPRVTADLVATGDPEQMAGIEQEMVRIAAEVHAGEITAEEVE